MAQVRDVVCGMTVDTATAVYQSQYKGQTYYFCSGDCKRTFDQAPESHVRTGDTASRGQGMSERRR
jgi:P-type Cu+ transporter